MVIIGVAAATAYGGYRQYRTVTVVDRSAKLISSDLALARSLAVQRRAAVSLVADEAARTYEVRDTSGNVFVDQAFTASSDLSLTALDVRLPGDSVAFNARGVAIAVGDIEIAVARLGETRVVEVSALGRTKVVEP